MCCVCVDEALRPLRHLLNESVDIQASARVVHATPVAAELASVPMSATHGCRMLSATTAQRLLQPLRWLDDSGRGMSLHAGKTNTKFGTLIFFSLVGFRSPKQVAIGGVCSPAGCAAIVHLISQ
jgi:hypothetical protein